MSLPLQQGDKPRGRPSKSGVCGVSLVSRKLRNGDLKIDWEARWYEGGTPSGESFSVLRHGYRGAWKKALRARAKAVGKRVPRIDPPAPPKWLVKWINSREWGNPLHR